MATFNLYNYEFGKILNHEPEDLFGNKPVIKEANEAFPQRQEILDDILIRDYQKTEEFNFVNNYNSKVYGHKHMMPPTDGMAVLRVRNVVRKQLHNENWTTEVREDYPDCIVVIDNRPGIQRIAIETKKIAFKGDWTLPNIVSATLNKILRPYSLHVELRNVPNEQDFWAMVNDKEKYPQGFHKLRILLPHLNLERLHKVFVKLGEQMRQSFSSNLEMTMSAQRGGALTLSKEIDFQKDLIHAVSEVGGKTAETKDKTVVCLYSNDNKNKPIPVGAKSFQTFFEPASTFDRLVEDAAGNNLFDSGALDTIKKQTKKGID